MLTGPVRRNARKDGAIGCLSIGAAAVLLLLSWGYLEGIQGIFAGIGYVGEVLFIAIGLLVGAVILLRYWLRTEADCDQIDANTRAYDPNAVHHYATHDDPRDHTGGIHYDGDYSKSYPVSVDGEHFMMDSQGNLTKEE